jgi:hypothetical protein
VATANLSNKTGPRDQKELRKLVDRAQKGDESTLPVLRDLLRHPTNVESFGNVALHAENALIHKFVGKDVAVREGIRRKMDAMRAELAGSTPTPLERLLVERIAVCWLHLYYLESLYASQDSMTFNQGIYYQRSIDRAHRRYLTAIKTLSVVRKLALPVLQVNIAQQQVNVAGPSVATEAERKSKGPCDA